MNLQALLASQIINWTGIFALAFIGFFAVVGFFSKRKESIEEKASKESKYLIGLLQGTVKELETKLAHQTTSLTDAMNRLTTLEAENNLFKDIFQGRDETMQKFMKDGFEAMSAVPKMMQMIDTTNRNVEKLYQAIEQHLAIIQATNGSKPVVVNTNIPASS